MVPESRGADGGEEEEGVLQTEAEDERTRAPPAVTFKDWQKQRREGEERRDECPVRDTGRAKGQRFPFRLIHGIELVSTFE